MANYEPLRPQVIGPQWSPVRQESFPLDLGTEIGYTFTVTGDSGSLNSPQFVHWTTSQIPTTLVQGQTAFASIYRRGEEDNVGRIYRLIITPTAVLVTGAVTSDGGTALSAIADPYDDRYILLPTGNSAVRIFFDINSADDIVLQNRRILKVNLLYTASGPFNSLDNISSGVAASIESNSIVWSMGLGSISGPLSPLGNANVSRVNLGEVNPFWNAGANPFMSSDRYPWRWEELNRLSQNEPITTRLAIGVRGINLPVVPSPIRLGFFALEIVLCEENRLWYGGNAMGFATNTPFAFDGYGFANEILLRTTSFQTTGSLSPGDYTVTLTLADSGDVYNRGGKARVSALREAESLALPGPQGVIVTRWQDPDGDTETLIGNSPFFVVQYEFPGDPPTVQSSHILPGIGISSSDSGNPQIDQTATHTYVTQLQANVLDNTVAQQAIVNNANGAQVFYPWVRFYARHFGNLSRTLQLRAISGTTGSVSITQEEFDALPEIVDGWREVTLRFDSSTPSYSNDGSLATWQWETIGGSVTIKNKWEILGAYGDGIGTAESSYGIQSNASATFNNISRQPNDEVNNILTDLMLMFSQDPPAVSGLAVDVLSQEVTGIGLDCGSSPDCIPTGIAYHHITWNPGMIVCDTFSRSVTGGWGSADTGQAYSVVGTASDYEVINGQGAHIQVTGVGSHRTALDSVVLTDVDLQTSYSINQTPVGGSITLGFTARSTDSNNQYTFGARANTNGTITAIIERIVAGVFATVASATVPNIQFAANKVFNIRAQIEGTTLRIRVWEQGAPEPSVWHASGTDATYSSGSIGFRSNVAAGYVGAHPVRFTVDNFTASAITVVDNTYELQRQDDVDPTWHTIMTSTSLCPISFNDYEARVGVVSRYRIRLVNPLRFPGPWSDEVSSTLTDPGVFGAGDGNGVLIFTTNERQAGTSNLAYVMQWSSAIEEDFQFPEASTVQLQRMYQRDNVIAFRPTERGGERFSRTILVKNAAVPSRLIRDGFTSLRDMAWEDVSYVCVRNELGDRWFAAVLVPSGVIRNDRKVYLARVDIVEVTDTPSPVVVLGI